MAAAEELLKVIGDAVLSAVHASVMDEFLIEVSPSLVEHAWTGWTSLSPQPEQRRADLEALVWLTGDDAELRAARAVGALKIGEDEVEKSLTRYLRLVPSMVRQYCKRPAQPTGTSVPAKLDVSGIGAVRRLLPSRLPWFQPGDRPAAIGDWELQDLLEVNAFGEVWKGVNPRDRLGSACALHFFVAGEAKEYLAREERDTLDRALVQVKHPAVVPLQAVHAHVAPPGVQYAHLEASSLVGLVDEWREADRLPDQTAVADIVRQLAEILGSLHHLNPPFVLRHLRPGNVLVRKAGPERWQCFLTRVGLGPWSGGIAGRSNIDPYASPEQNRLEPPQPRDDVYALGILWYQLLAGNFDAGRPGGSNWRRRLSEQGMATTSIELLESCFEDDPNYRPGDAAILAARLADTQSRGQEAGVRSQGAGVRTEGAGARGQETGARGQGSEEGGERRKRRADLSKLFDTLEQVEPQKPKLITNSVGLKLVLLPSATFAMGSPENEPGRRVNEGPVHEISLTRDFYVGVVPITQRHFERVMGSNPAYFQLSRGGDYDHPVESVTWEEAFEFCRKLSEMPEEKAAGRKYRLPTEAEWEYACRAGAAAMFAFGNRLGHGQANFESNFPFEGPTGFPLQKTCVVASYPANNFGLYDMHGNVWEWCADWLGHDYYVKSSRRDPQGPSQGAFRVLRGGSWRNHALTCRSAYRNGLAPNLRDKYTGFRVVLEA